MRIWIVNHYALPPASAGGTRHYNLARQLQQRGHDVLIIAANYNHFSHSHIPSDVPYGEVDHSCGVPFIWLPVRGYSGNTLARFGNMLGFSVKVVRHKLLHTLKRPDVIIGSSPQLFAAVGAERLARKLGCPFVLEIRDIWPESLVDLGRFTHRHPLIKTMKWLERYLYRRAHRVITLLPNATDYLVANGVAQKNILWVPNSVDAETVLEKNLQQNEIDEGKKFTVMYAGAHGIANDLDTVISAAAILEKNPTGHQLEICLLGEGPEKKRLQQRCITENINMVRFLEPVNKNAVYDVLNQADAYLMLLKPSPVFRWGISPNKLFDYLIMQRPVIFGVETPTNPVALSRAGITIAPGDPVSLAAAIQQLAVTPESERKAMGQRGREYVLQHHALPRLADALEKMLMEI